MEEMKIAGLNVKVVNNDELRELSAKWDEVLFLGTRCVDMLNPVQGSTSVSCDTCGFEVWVTPGSRMSYFKVVPREKMKVQCMQCAIPMEEEV